MTDCRTGKRRYPGVLTAKIALIRINRRKPDNPRRQEIRVYHCRMCDGWHLTSSRI